MHDGKQPPGQGLGQVEAAAAGAKSWKDRLCGAPTVVGGGNAAASWACSSATSSGWQQSRGQSYVHENLQDSLQANASMGMTLECG